MQSGAPEVPRPGGGGGDWGPGLCFPKALSILRAWPVRGGGNPAIPRPDQLGLRHTECLQNLFNTGKFLFFAKAERLV